ncbi:hypothetical protein [Aliterella atlantica]|uniref:hypothetical protein n=1 Tax=Aliterella atlantica TaxID=1827278 RepID=UPI001186A701|nr:hypothetical protein [Aliterella atlantica]
MRHDFVSRCLSPSCKPFVEERSPNAEYIAIWLPDSVETERSASFALTLKLACQFPKLQIYLLCQLLTTLATLAAAHLDVF